MFLGFNIRVILRLYWGYIGYNGESDGKENEIKLETGIIQGYIGLGFIGVILWLYWGYIGIMQDIFIMLLETTIMGLYRV